MTDKELLELVAKAVGIEGEWVENSLMDDYYKLPTTGILTVSEGRTHVWNPLTSSGDALRLAVTLRLVIDVGPISVSVHKSDGEHDLGFEFYRTGKDDPYTATRRAIVFAAAEIWKGVNNARN